MKKIRYGMVGGGEGAFIGEVHREGARLDDCFELVCGAFSRDPQRSIDSGLGLGLDEARCYADFTAMIEEEAALPIGERMQCVVIVTPNSTHFPIAKLALENGFHVMSDKPATFNLAECEALADILDDTGLLYGLTHAYTAYPMIREARERVAAGQLGTVRKILVEYTQGWLSATDAENASAQAAWRLDPARAGISSCMGDIGVHAFNLAEFVSGLSVSRLSAELNRIVDGRLLDDDGTVLMHYENGARGTLMASQVCIGEENYLRLRIYGDKAALDWMQMEPNNLWLKYPDKPAELLRTGMPYLGPGAAANTRVPAGHPEGYIEAFGNLYRTFAEQIHAFSEGEVIDKTVPGIQDALRGMAFIETAVASSKQGNRWLDMPDFE